MNIAKKIFESNHLDQEKSLFELNIALTTLDESATNVYRLLGSKRCIYDFEDGSRIVWHANPNLFQLNN